MELWTDGETHVQTVDYDPGNPSCVRVYRGGALAKEAALPEIKWRNPLAVDPAAGRIYAGQPLVELDLDTLERVKTHDLPCDRIACLGEGRFAVVVGGDDRKHGVLRIGALGQPWEQEIPLVVGKAPRRIPGVTGEKARSQRFRYNIRMGANKHGIAVAAEQHGVVALIRPGAKGISRHWHYTAAAETELLVEPTPEGVLAVPRWAGRDAHVHRLIEKTGDYSVLLSWGYGSFACFDDAERVFLFDNRAASVRTLTAKAPRASREVRGFIQAAAAGGGAFVLGFMEGIHVLREQEGGLSCETALARPVLDLVITFPSEPEEPFSDLSRRVRESVKDLGAGRGMGGGTAPDGSYRLVLNKIDPSKAEEARRRVAALGFPSVEIVPGEL